MDNKHILEEIDIIVRAQVDKAREDLKKISKETDKVVNDVSKEFKKMDSLKDILAKSFDSSSIEELKTSMKMIEKEQNVLFNKLRQTPNFFTDDDFKQMDIAATKIEIIAEKLQELGVPYIEVNDFPEIQQQNVHLDKTLEVDELQQKLNDLNTYTLRDQIKIVEEQVKQTFPAINSLANEFKNRINDTGSLIGLLASKLNQVGNVASSIGNKITSTFNKVKTNVSSAFQNIFDTVKQKIGPTASIFNSIGVISKSAFQQAVANINEFANKFKGPINKIKEFINKIRGIGSETDSQKKKAKTFGADFGKGLEGGIKSIKKFVLSLLGVRTAFSAISKASQAYLSFDTQLSESLQNSWNVLGSLLAPILEYVIGLFSKLVSVVAQLVKALTGIDLVARANAKALDKQAKSASKAGGLSSIDDISVLNSSSDSSETATLTVEDIDTSPLEAFMIKASEILSKIFEPFKLAWENVGSGVIQSISDMISNLGSFGSAIMNSLFEVWTNGTGQEIIENALLSWQQVFDIVSSLAEAFADVWNNADIGTSVIQKIADIFKDIQEFGLSIRDSVLKWVVSDGFKEALKTVFSFVDDIFGVTKDICDWLLAMYDTYLKPVIDNHLLPAISEIIKSVGEIWEAIKPVIENAIQWIEQKLEPIIKDLCNALGNIIEVGKNIAQFFAGVFTGDWQKAWDAIKGIISNTWNAIKSLFSAGGKIFEGVVEGIANVFKTIVNALIGGINQVIALPFKELNKILAKIQNISFLGIEPFSWLSWRASVPEIPKLASGNVAYKETYAIFGEYTNARQNPEITSPVNLMEETFDRVLSNHEDTGTRVEKLILNVLDENFYDGAIDYINNESVRRGVSVIKEV